MRVVAPLRPPSTVAKTAGAARYPPREKRDRTESGDLSRLFGVCDTDSHMIAPCAYRPAERLDGGKVDFGEARVDRREPHIHR